MKTTLLALAVPLVVAGAAWAQDSTQPKPVAPPAPAASTSAALTIVQAVLTDSVVNRMPADSGTAYPATVGSASPRSAAARPARASTMCGSTATPRWATSSCTWMAPRGARGAARRFPPTGRERGMSK